MRHKTYSAMKAVTFGVGEKKKRQRSFALLSPTLGTFPRGQDCTTASSIERARKEIGCAELPLMWHRWHTSMMTTLSGNQLLHRRR